LATQRTDPDLAVADLLTDAIDDFEKLQVTIHLYRASTALQSSEAIAAAVSLPRDTVVDVLTELTRARVVKQAPLASDRWAFDRDGPWANDVALLHEKYDQDPFGIASQMARLAVARVRSQAARMFADAFVVRSKAKKGDSDP
jgi:hypothetical protein